MLKQKYLPVNEVVSCEPDTLSSATSDIHDHLSESQVIQEIAIEPPREEKLLHKIKYDMYEFYVDIVDNGNVYDIEHNIVGKFINNQIEVDSKLMRQYVTERLTRTLSRYCANIKKF